MDSVTSPVELLDHRMIQWEHVRQSRYWMYQRFEYHYPGRIRELRQRLMVFPHDQYGDQRLCAYELRISSPEATKTSMLDTFGNRVVLIYTSQVESIVSFEAWLVVERHFETLPPVVPAEVAVHFLQPTALTTADGRIAAIAASLAAQHADPAALATAINSWVYQAMSYLAGATTVNTTAAQALALGRGLCQDYAHIMLAICRASGLAARYVSGHLLGEGGSHAWVEVFLPTGDGRYCVVAYDPTNHRRITPAYITVAVGRDFNDVSPTTGSFLAPFPGRLTTSKRAGVTHLEYRNVEG